MSGPSFPPHVSSSSCCSAMAIIRNVEVTTEAKQQVFTGMSSEMLNDEYRREYGRGIS